MRFYLLAVALSMPVAAFAQRWEVAPTAAVFRPGRSPLGSLPDNVKKHDRDTRLKHGPGYGVRVTRNTEGYWGVEGTFIRVRYRLSALVAPEGETAATREDTISSDFGSFNVLSYFMPSGERWRPFITGGVHTQRYAEPRIDGWTQGASRTYGGNVGGGIKLKLFKNALVRFDLRDYIGGKPYDLTFDGDKFGGLLHTIEASAGISIAF